VNQDKLIMQYATTRSILRWIHIVYNRVSECFIVRLKNFRSTPTYFEEIGHENGTRIRGIKIQ
jgi:hypothetical protein